MLHVPMPINATVRDRGAARALICSVEFLIRGKMLAENDSASDVALAGRQYSDARCAGTEVARISARNRDVASA